MINALDILSKEPLVHASAQARETKLRAIRIIDDELTQNIIMLNDTVEFPKVLSVALAGLLRILSDEDMNVWSLAKEVLNKHIKSKLKYFSERIVFELFRGMKGQKIQGRAQRISIELFAAVCHHIKPNRCHKFIQSLLPVVKRILKEEEDNGEFDLLLLETLGNSFEPIAAQLMPYFSAEEAQELVRDFSGLLPMKAGSVRRAAASAIVAIVRHYPSTKDLTAYTAQALQSMRLMNANHDADTESYSLQGQLHCFVQLFKLSLARSQVNKYLTDYMKEYITYCSNLSISCFTSKDNNVIVAALELFQVLFETYSDDIIFAWGRERTETEIKDVLTQFMVMMESPDLRITSKSSIVSCCTTLLSTSLNTLIFDSWRRQGGHSQKLLGYIKDLLDHQDQTLRGQASLFVAKMIAQEAALSALASFELGAIDFHVPNFIEKLLRLVHTDGSSITAKMACNGIVSCWFALSNSKFALWALYVIQSLLTIRADAFRLVKAEVIQFLSQVDYGLVNFLIKCGDKFISFVPCPHLQRGQQHLQLECVDKLRDYLKDPDQHVRQIATESLASLPRNIHYTSYWNKDPQWSGSYAPSVMRALPLSLRAIQGLAPFDHLFKKEESAHRSVLTLFEGSVDFEALYLGRLTTPNHSKAHWYLNEFIDGLYKNDDVVLLKGIYRIFSQMAQIHSVFPLPMSFVLPVIMDQVETLPVASDVDSQYDVLVFLSHIVGQLTGDLVRYSHRIFYHLIRVVYVVTAIVKKQPKVPYKDSSIGKATGQAESTLATIQGHPQYLKLWDRLADTYRIGRANFGEENMFEAVQRATFQGLSQCISKMTRQFIIPFVPELLGYLATNFDDQPLAVVETLRILFVATFNLNGHPSSVTMNQQPVDGQRAKGSPEEALSPNEMQSSLMLSPSQQPLFSFATQSLPNPNITTTTSANLINAANLQAGLQPVPVPTLVQTQPTSPRAMTPPQPGNQASTQTPNPNITATVVHSNSTHLPPTQKSTAQQQTTTIPTSTATPNQQPPQQSSSVQNARVVWGADGFGDVIRDLTSRQSPPQMSAVMKQGNTKHLLAMFEPIVAACMQKYLNTSDPHTQQAILQLLSSLIAYEVEFSALDKDGSFFRFVIAQLMGAKGEGAIAQLHFLSVLHLERRYLHNVLRVKNFQALLGQTFAQWDLYSPDFVPSLIQTVYVAFSPHALIASEEEKEVRIAIRTTIVTSITSKLPHKEAVNLLLYLLGILSEANTQVSTQSVQGNRRRTYTDSKILYVHLIFDGLVDLLSAKSSLEARFQLLTLQDMQALYYLVERLPRAAFKCDTVLRLMYQLLYDKDEERQRTKFYLRYRLTGLLLVWRMIFKFERSEILSTLASLDSEFTQVNLEGLTEGSDRATSILVAWIVECFGLIVLTCSYSDQSTTPIVSQLLDSVTFFVSGLSPQIKDSLKRALESQSALLLSLTVSFQSACGYAVIRLLSELRSHQALRLLLQMDCNAWHQDVLYSIAFLSIVRSCANEPKEVYHIGDHFQTLLGTNSNDESQQQSGGDDGFQFQEGFYFFNQEPRSDDDRKRLQCYRLLWSLVMHAQESAVKQVCRLLFQAPNLASFVFRFIDAFMRRIALGPHAEATIANNNTSNSNSLASPALSRKSTAIPSEDASVIRASESNNNSRQVEQHVSLMHNVLLVFTLLPREGLEESKQILRAIVEHFLGFPTPSVQLAAEAFVMHLLDKQTDSASTQTDEKSVLVDLLRTYYPKLRKGFIRTLKQTHQVSFPAENLTFMELLHRANREAKGVEQQTSGEQVESLNNSRSDLVTSQGALTKSTNNNSGSLSISLSPTSLGRWLYPWINVYYHHVPKACLALTTSLRLLLQQGHWDAVCYLLEHNDYSQFYHLLYVAGSRRANNNINSNQQSALAKSAQATPSTATQSTPPTTAATATATATNSDSSLDSSTSFVVPVQRKSHFFRQLIDRAISRLSQSPENNSNSNNSNSNDSSGSVAATEFRSVSAFEQCLRVVPLITTILIQRERGEGSSAGRLTKRNTNSASLAIPQPTPTSLQAALGSFLSSPSLSASADVSASMPASLASSTLIASDEAQPLPSLIVLHHLCVDLLAYLTAQMVARSGQFQPKALINCIELLKQILKNLPMHQFEQLAYIGQSHKVYSIVDGDFSSLFSTTVETEFEWRVRIIHSLYVLLFKQPPSANSALPAYHADMEEGLKRKENITEASLDFFWHVLHKSGRGTFSSDQKKTRIAKISFSYIHDDFLILFQEFAKDFKKNPRATCDQVFRKGKYANATSSSAANLPGVARDGVEGKGGEREARSGSYVVKAAMDILLPANEGSENVRSATESQPSESLSSPTPTDSQPPQQPSDSNQTVQSETAQSSSENNSNQQPAAETAVTTNNDATQSREETQSQVESDQQEKQPVKEGEENANASNSPVDSTAETTNSETQQQQATDSKTENSGEIEQQPTVARTEANLDDESAAKDSQSTNVVAEQKTEGSEQVSEVIESGNATPPEDAKAIQFPKEEQRQHEKATAQTAASSSDANQVQQQQPEFHGSILGHSGPKMLFPDDESPSKPPQKPASNASISSSTSSNNNNSENSLSASVIASLQQDAAKRNSGFDMEQELANDALQEEHSTLRTSFSGRRDRGEGVEGLSFAGMSEAMEANALADEHRTPRHKVPRSAYSSNRSIPVDQHSQTQYELDMFPLQEESINFDNNEDPIGVIATFIAIIRACGSLCEASYIALWRQLYEVVSVSGQDEVASTTTPALKALALRGLVILLLKWSAQISSESASTSKTPTNANTNNSNATSTGNKPPQNNVASTPVTANLSESKEQGYEQMLDHLNDLLHLLTGFLGQYRENRHHEALVLHHETMKAFVQLTSLMSLDWLQWTLAEYYAIGKALPEVGEDPFVRQCIVVGIGRFAVEIHLDDLALRAPSKGRRRGPDAVTVPNCMPLLGHLIHASFAEDYEVMEQLAALQACWDLASMRHPYVRVLAANSTILNWLFVNKDTKERLGSGLFQNKLRQLYDMLVQAKNTSEEEQGLSYVMQQQQWGDRLALAGHLFGLPDQRANELILVEAAPDDTLRLPEKQGLEDGPDVLMLTMSKIKDLFQRIRTAKTVEVQVLAVSEVSQVLMDSFDADQILSIFLNEISRPQDNGHLVTEALARVSESHNKYKKDNSFQQTSIKWITMCFDNFVQLTMVSVNATPNQALYNMTCFFLIACPGLALQRQFLHDIYYSHIRDEVVEEIFLLSGIAFANLLTAEARNDIVKSLSKIAKDPYLSLLQNIQLI